MRRDDLEEGPPSRLRRPMDQNEEFPGNDSGGAPRRPRRDRPRLPDGEPGERGDRRPREREHRERFRHERISPRHEADDESLPEAERIQRRLTTRYTSPAVAHLVRTISPQRCLELYAEVSGLIDARHLKPSTYDARVKQAAKNLYQAVGNRAFLQVNEVADDPARIGMFREDMLRLINSRLISGAEEAQQALQWTVQVGQRDLGLRPAAIVLEFVFAAADSLDKYSAFVPALDRRAPSVDLEDHVVGIGVEIKAEERGLLIAKALPGGPAAEAGLTSGDLIESVDGHPLARANMESAVEWITGPAGSRIVLGVRRGDRTAQVSLTRRRVEVHSVSEVRMLDGDVGYIKLDKFAQNSSDEFDKALWGLYRQGMKSLVVDVRGNPGGLLTTAIELSNKFVPSGTIVSTRGRDRVDNMVERATRRQAWKLPLVVLVDENSASASEIFAAAVQENGRGLIVGRRTYGKGTVQTHFPLQTVSGTLRLTTAQFFSPSGRVMAGAGVQPDVPVESEGRRPLARYDRDSYPGHDAGYGREHFHHREAAYRHGGDPSGSSSAGNERDIAAAVEAARSPRAAELARAAGERQSRTLRGSTIEY